MSKVNRERLRQLIDAPNIADILAEEDKLGRIGGNVCEHFVADDEHPDRLAKKEKWKQGKKLVKQEVENKSNHRAGLENAANIKYPLLTTASIQFSARAYPGIVQDQQVAKPKIIGEETPEKEQQGDVVTQFINWQLFNQFDEWESDTDKMLLQLPLYGCMFRKVYFSRAKNRIKTDILTPEQLVVPHETKSLWEASRISECFKLSPRDVVQRVRSGHFRELNISYDDEIKESPEEFIEQHCWLDLDEDGFKEPYIVVVHKGSEEVARISANYNIGDIEVNDEDEVVRIDPVQYFVKYTFIPSPDDGFYDLGFYDLLYPINETVNTIINQLVDAGTLANSNTGFISQDLKLRRKGPLHVKIGEYITVNGSGEDIRKGILPMQFRGADSVLFQLLGFVLDAGRDVAQLKEVLEGQVEQNMTATTTMALIEQGLKVFSAIYKRIHRGLGQELQLIRRWNYLTTNPLYDAVLDLPQAVNPEMFNSQDFNFEPVSDPNVVTDLQKAARAQFYMQFLKDPYHDQYKLREKIYEGMNAGDFKDVASGQNPEIKKLTGQFKDYQKRAQKEITRLAQEVKSLKQEQKNKNMEYRIKAMEQARKNSESRFSAKKTISETIRNLADAESKEPGRQLPEYTKQAKNLDADFEYDPQSGMIRAAGQVRR